jgi:hypothetical protein
MSQVHTGTMNSLNILFESRARRYPVCITSARMNVNAQRTFNARIGVDSG